MEWISKQAEIDAQCQRIMTALKVSEAEAREILAYDAEVEHTSKAEFDLPPDKLEVARKYAHTGTRKMKETGLNLPKKERKPNEAKREIMEVLRKAIADISPTVTVTNIERQLSFELDGETYEVTLVQKRKPKN